MSFWSACVSEKALNVAQSNKHNLEAENIDFMRSDLFEELNHDITFNTIVSNPPYIPTIEILGLDSEVKDHDPLIALDGGRDGLDFYRRIIDKSGDYLEDGGYLAMETGYDETDKVMSLMINRGYREVGSLKDMGNNPRIVFGML